MFTIDQARALDANDPLAKYRDQFVITDETLCYLDGNSLGRTPKSTITRINDFLHNEWAAQLVGGWAHWIDMAQSTGDLIGRASLGAASGQVLAMDTTSVNFYRAVRAAIAARPGRKTIITDEANFPTDRYIMQGIAEELGLTLITIPNDLRPDNIEDGGSVERITTDLLREYLSDDVAVVSFSIVQYRSGALNPVAQITQLANSFGALTVWDASHAVGAVDLKFDQDLVDFAVGCTYKYTNAGPGAPAWLYISSRIQQQTSLPIQGWFAQENQFEMGPTFQQTAGMRGFQIASPSIIGLYSITESFNMIEQATLAQIAHKAAVGTDMMIAQYDELLAPLGFQLVTPRDSSERGGHISIYHEEAERISRGLRSAKNVIPDYRTPNCIRLAISPLPTSYSEAWEGMHRLAEYAASNEWRQLSKTPPKVT